MLPLSLIGAKEDGYCDLAKEIESDLAKNGASFFDQIQQRKGLYRALLEQGLAELVSMVSVTSENQQEPCAL